MIWDVIKSIIRIFYTPIKLAVFRHKWRLKNPENTTVPFLIFPMDRVKVGDFTYGFLEVYSWDTENEKLEIGSFCSIAPSVKFLLGGNHEMSKLSTFPFKFFFENKVEATSKGPIIIGDDVWIGVNSIIFSGIEIGRGCVIAGGSVVTKSFPPYSVVGGNPARLIKKRFGDDVIEKLLQIDYRKIDKKFVLENRDILDKKNIEIQDIENLVKR